jgi:large subunit ribosomal protein L30
MEKLIAAIRIRGQVGVRKDIKRTLELLKLNKKHHCIVVKENPSFIGMFEKCKDFITWGEISENILLELIKKRGRKPGNKKLTEEEALKFLEEIKSGKMQEKPFRLSPPRKGFKNTRLHYPKGDLGERKNIDDLIKRMM